MVSTAATLETSTRPAGVTKTIRVGVLSTINKLDPREAVDYVSAVVLAQIFDTPYVAMSGEAGVRPLLFEPLRRENSIATEYSAEVRSGVRFSDGTPLTPEIAVRSLRTSSALASKASVELRGDRVWFTLKFPNPRFELTLAQSGCAIVLDRTLQLVGTGPFMFAQRPNLRLLQNASSVNLVRNPHYAGRCSAEELRFVVLPAEVDGSPVRLITALRAGEIDITTALATSDLTTHHLVGLSAAMQPSNSTAVLFLNNEQRSLRSRDLRRAIASAIDVHEVASAAYARNPMAFVAASLLPPAMGRAVSVTQFDRTAAAKLVEQLGLRGSRLTMVVPWAPRPYLPKPAQVAQTIQRQLGEIGISVSLLATGSSDEFFSALHRGNFDLALAGWIADTPDPADFFEAMLWSASVGGDTHSNYGRWKDAATDLALGRFRTAPTEANRHELDRIIREEVPFIPLMYGQSTAIHARRLRNVAISPIGVLPLAEVVT